MGTQAWDLVEGGSAFRCCHSDPPPSLQVQLNKDRKTITLSASMKRLNNFAQLSFSYHLNLYSLHLAPNPELHPMADSW